MRLVRRLLLLGLILYFGAWAYRIVTRKYYVWLPGYVSWLFHQEKAAGAPVHVFFSSSITSSRARTAAMMDRWVSEYPKIAGPASRQRGAPVAAHVVLPGEQPIDRNMTALQKLVAGGYGETELHLHHFNDTPQSARERFQRAIAWFQTFGFLRCADGATHFGFIHGNWSLDNSRGNAFCGNNRELAMLRELGCFGDYTFSSIFYESQPSSVNNIFEATDDDRRNPTIAAWRCGLASEPAGDLLIFQGPLLLVPTARPAKLFLEVENAGDSRGGAGHAAPRGRLDAGQHPRGRTSRVAVRQDPHARRQRQGRTRTRFWGPELDQALTYMEKTYNDGAHYVLHYVTAREAFNRGAGGGGWEAGRSAAVLRLFGSAVCGEFAALRAPEPEIGWRARAPAHVYEALVIGCRRRRS